MEAGLAESCTGGWVAKVLTDIAGSSAWFERGFVTYSNAAKQELLDVRAATLKASGAVSEHTAREMAQGHWRTVMPRWCSRLPGSPGRAVAHRTSRWDWCGLPGHGGAARCASRNIISAATVRLCAGRRWSPPCKVT